MLIDPVQTHILCEVFIFQIIDSHLAFIDSSQLDPTSTSGYPSWLHPMSPRAVCGFYFVRLFAHGEGERQVNKKLERIMRLTDILQADCIKVPLAATNKQDAIRELVDLLTTKAGIETSRDELWQAVWSRETTRATGIGHGVAIPHGKSACLKKLTMAIGKTAAPMEYNAIDGRPVELILLLTSPIDQTGPHIHALAKISRMLIDDKFRSALKKAETAEEMFKLISDHEANEPA